MREEVYSPRRDAPGGNGRPGRAPGPPGGGGEDPWDDRGGSRARGAARFGTGVRDIRDELRDRLRRNGVSGDWDEPGGRRGRRRLGGDWGDGPDGPDGPEGPEGGKARRKGSWWRHWSWKKALTVMAAFFGLLIILAAAGVAYAYSKTPIPNPQATVFQQASKVYFSDDKTVVGQFGSTNRVLLTYNQIPSMVANAVVAAEDKNFWHEGGISPTGIIRAAYYDLTSSSGSLQGGSTITQQLVRNYYDGIGTAQTASRKIKEIFVAAKLAQVKSKAWILTQYLNTIPFGRGAYGIGAAAEVYFGVGPNDLSKLTPAQAAMLAAMIQQPNGYNPDPKAGAAYTGLVYRWRYVLSEMASIGALSRQAEAQALQKFPAVIPPPNNTWNGYSGYIMQAVLNELEFNYHYTLPQINTMGLHVVTTFNQRLMNSLYAAVRSNERLMKHCAGPSVLPSAAQATCTGLPRYVRAGALLENVKNGAILAMYSGPNYNRQHCHCQFDNALQSRNQVGSSFKPYVLATAVSQGMNVQTSTLNGDSPLWIAPDTLPTAFSHPGNSAPSGPSGSQYYEVRNDESGNNNFGGVSVLTATAASLNTAYADLWHRVAYNSQTRAHPVIDMAKAFGVDVQASGLTTMQDEAGTALGQGSLTVEEQATTIATMADHGVYHTPHVIEKIITANNTVIPAKITTRTVLTPAQAADVDWAMSGDMSSGGTAAGLGLTNGQVVIAKTGTTNLAQSAFFLGATPKYAMADALFVNHPGCTLPPSLQYECTSTSALAYTPPKGLQTLFGVGGVSGYGGQFPALIWHTFFMKNFNRVAVQQWPALDLTGMTRWNLFGKQPKPKKQDNQGQGCQGPPGQCRKGGGGPTPTANPTPTATPTGNPTPTATPTFPHGAVSTGGGGRGGASPEALALALVFVAGPSLPLVTRLRSRRRRARPRPPGG